MNEFQFTAEINRTPELWGSAVVTGLEWEEICNVRRDTKSWEEVHIALLAGDMLPPTTVSETSFIAAAVAHGCPVAYPLYMDEERTPETTAQSYIWKNKAFRFISRTLRIAKKTDLLASWLGYEDKIESEVGKIDLIRPVVGGVEIPLNGIEKVECYWPSQMLRVLEAARLGIEKPIELKSNQQASVFAIPWTNFSEVILASETSEDICVGFASETAQQMRKNGLDDMQIAELLLIGFSPGGPLKEHGQITKVSRIWNRILEVVGKIDESEILVERLLRGYSDRIQKVGFEI